MVGIVVPETCWAYKKYNIIISDIWLVFYSSKGPVLRKSSDTLKKIYSGANISVFNLLRQIL